MAQIFGRYEPIADIAITNGFNQLYALPTNGGQIPNNRFIFGLKLKFEGRATFAANGPTGVLADGVHALIEKIIVQGYHRPRAALEQFINVRGADMHIWHQLYTARPTLVTPAALLTGNSVNDIRFSIFVPFVPLHLPIDQQVQYLLDAPNYDNLILNVQLGNDFSIFSGQTAGAVAWTAFGSASGNPRVRVSAEYSQAGPSFYQNIIPGRIWRYFFENTTGNIISGATASREFNVPRGYTQRAALLKFGTKATTTTAGLNAYSALSNTIPANIQVQFGLNRAIRNFQALDDIQEQFADSVSYPLTPFPVGYGPIDFAQLGLQSEALNLSGAIAGPTGDIDTFIQTDLTAGANQADLVMYEEFRGQMSSVSSGR
jgi:hypothetical protein